METPVNDAIHNRMHDLLLQYIIVGGMPKAVATFMETKHMGEVAKVQRAIFENLLADVFGKMGRRLYYFRKDSGLELDFLIRYKGLCTPIECKAENGNAKSLKTVMNNPDKYHIEQALKIGNYNVARSGGILNIPHYMAFLLTDV